MLGGGAMRTRSPVSHRSIAARAVLAAALGLAGCGKKHAPGGAVTAPAADDAGPPEAAGDAGAATAEAATPPWPALAGMPLGAPWRIIELPAAPAPAGPAVRDAGAPVAAAAVPPGEASAGPVMIGDVAVVATSRAGFVGIDTRNAAVAWSRPAGPRVAPPVALGDHVVLIGDCPVAPRVAKGEVALGCYDVVDPVRAADAQAGVVHGPARALAGFVAAGRLAPRARSKRAAPPPPVAATAADADRTASDGQGGILWRRGDHAVRFDLDTGVATAAPADAVTDHVDVDYQGAHWTYTYEHGDLTGRNAGAPAARWHFPAAGLVLVGAFDATPPRIPVVRLAGSRGPPTDRPVRRRPHRARAPIHTRGPAPARARAARPRSVLLFDVDGVEGHLGSVSHAVPGVAVLASAFGEGGATVLVIRLDDTATRDYVAAFDGNGMLMWAWPLPEPDRPRTALPGLALTEGWIVAHFDDRLALLPLVSEPPTPPAGPSQNPTP
jgi:hypothetical protein